MIQGQKIWSEDMISDMDFREISGRKIFTFTHMKNNYYEVLQDAASKYPSKIAFYDDRNQPYTYEHFIQMVDNFAEGLNNRGARKHDHIGLLLYNSIEFCVAFYAACKLGAVTVPFPSKYRKQEIQALIEKADLNFLIVSDKFKEWVETYKETITITYSVDEENGYGFRHLSLPDGKRGGATGELDDEVILMFTSGTTSDSKGVVLKNYNVLHATMIYQRLCNITPEDITVIPVPIYHVTGLIALLGVFVYSGGTICLQKKYDARRILECIINNKVTFMHGSPTVFSIMIGKVCNEEKVSDDIMITVESGIYGGVQAGGIDFGIGQNLSAMIGHHEQMDYYNGAGVDITFMGLGELGEDGSVNSTKMGTRCTGAGGFIDITQNAKKVVFLGTFTARGAEYKFDNGKLNIVKEGKIRKMVKQVAQLSFNGPMARKKGQEVVIITERAVFELCEKGVLLTEIAPGIDLQTQILDMMEFKPFISPDLKLMDEKLFIQDGSFGLRLKELEER